jgi:hypothetical protein
MFKHLAFVDARPSILFSDWSISPGEKRLERNAGGARTAQLVDSNELALPGLIERLPVEHLSSPDRAAYRPVSTPVDPSAE